MTIEAKELDFKRDQLKEVKSSGNRLLDAQFAILVTLEEILEELKKLNAKP